MNLPWLEAVRREFSDRQANGRLAHALLLAGPPGTGKLDLATELVAGLLCLEKDAAPCGNCRSCAFLGTGAHPDYRELTLRPHEKTGKLRSEIIVAQVRDLIGALALTTTVGTRKAALIHPAEAMNRNAANALLKTLEEPPGDTVIVLVSDDPGRLPVTIRSRCQNLNVRPPTRQQALEWLMAAGNLEEAEALSALEAASGSPLLARTMHAEGHTEQFRIVRETLGGLEARQTDIGAALASLSEVEPGHLWTWLSFCVAERLKRRLDASPSRDNGARAAPDSARELARLQTRADRNRRLLDTPVRRDLLLQDWLIQWAELSAGRSSGISG